MTDPLFLPSTTPGSHWIHPGSLLITTLIQLHQPGHQHQLQLQQQQQVLKKLCGTTLMTTK